MLVDGFTMLRLGRWLGLCERLVIFECSCFLLDLEFLDGRIGVFPDYV